MKACLIALHNDRYAGDDFEYPARVRIDVAFLVPVSEFTAELWVDSVYGSHFGYSGRAEDGTSFSSDFRIGALVDGDTHRVFSNHESLVHKDTEVGLTYALVTVKALHNGTLDGFYAWEWDDLRVNTELNSLSFKQVPEGGSSALMLGIGGAALMIFRKAKCFKSRMAFALSRIDTLGIFEAVFARAIPAR